MLRELEIYRELKDAIIVHLSSLKHDRIDDMLESEGMIRAYAKVLQDDKINTKFLDIDNCEKIIKYCTNEMGIE